MRLRRHAQMRHPVPVCCPFADAIVLKIAPGRSEIFLKFTFWAAAGNIAFVFCYALGRFLTSREEKCFVFPALNSISSAANCAGRMATPSGFDRRRFEMLRLFAANAGRVLSKQELMEAIWPNVHVGEDSLFQCIREIRSRARR